MKKRFIVFLVCLIIFTGTFVGCNGEQNEIENDNKNSNVAGENQNNKESKSEDKDDKVEDETKNESEKLEKLEFPFVEPGTVTLTYAGIDNWYSAASYADNLQAQQLWEEKTGVKINYEVYPAPKYDEAIQIRLSAGENLPDIFIVPPRNTSNGIFKYASQGVIIPLNDLIEKYAPNVREFFKNDLNLKGMQTAPDGNIYTLCDYNAEVNNLVFETYLIRQDWLDNLELDLPVTKDDWYDMLVAFRDEDPNGNGENDEIPLLHKDILVHTLMGTAFGYKGFGGFQSGMFNDFGNGKVECAYMQSEFKETLEFLNKLYNEELLDAEIERDKASFNSIISQNLVGAVKEPITNISNFDAMVQTTGAGCDYVAVLPPSMGDEKVNVYKRASVGSQYGISSTCEYPEVAIQWMDYLWLSEEGFTLKEFGIEGLTYEMVNGKPQYTEFVLNNPDGLGANHAIRSTGAMPSILTRATEYIFKIKQPQKIVDMGEKYRDNLLNPFPSLIFNEAQAETWQDIYPDLETYMQESLIKFIVGINSLDEFDEFVAQCEKIGIKDLIDLKQEQYDFFLETTNAK